MRQSWQESKAVSYANVFFQDECMFRLDMPIMFRKVMKKTEYLRGGGKTAILFEARSKKQQRPFNLEVG